MRNLIIAGATVVTPDAVLEDCDLLIEEGKFSDMGRLSADRSDASMIDASGCIVLPGIIDLHTDALEMEITPRPGANFPLEVALQEIDAKMLCCGITTVYHSLHLGYDAATLQSKSKYDRREVFQSTFDFGRKRALCNSRIHLRFEIVGPHALPLLRELLDAGMIDLLSFMDHTPGQGQTPRENFLKRSVENGLSEEQALAKLDSLQGRPRASESDLRALVKSAKDQGIAVASHDDDSADRVQFWRDMGVEISEFPINDEAALKARELGMLTLGGASNVLRGGSLSGNLCMTDAIRAKRIDGLCSDYYPPSILHAVFNLWNDRVCSLRDAVRLATAAPAQAAGIDHFTGSIEVGKDADFIVVRLIDGLPKVTRTYVRGHLAHSAASRLPDPLNASARSTEDALACQS